MCARRHTELVRTGCQIGRPACNCHAVGDAMAFLLVLVATAAILALAGLAIVGGLNAIAWVVGQ